MPNFSYDGTPKINRKRVLEDIENNLPVERESPELTQEQVDELFDNTVPVAKLGEDILDELVRVINNTIPVPESAGQVRAAIIRRSTIPAGQWIDFNLFHQSVDLIIKASFLKSSDLIDFTGDPNTDTQEYLIKQRQNIGDSLSTVDLFLAGAVIPAAYIASRLVAQQLVGPIPVLNNLVGEAIAFLFLLGLDRLAIKAQIEKSKINTTINGMSADAFVDFLADNPSEIHKILKDANIPDTNKIEDFKIIRDFALKYISTHNTSEYDSWLAYYHIANSQSMLERVIEVSPRYSQKWAFAAGDDFNIKEFVRGSSNRLTQAAFSEFRAGNNTLRSAIRNNLIPMKGAYKQSMIQMVAQARSGYRNIITSLMHDYLPFPKSLDVPISIPGLSGIPQIAITINLNKTLLCCVVRIFSAFSPDTLRLYARILRLGSMGIRLNFQNLMGKYVQTLYNQYVFSVIGMVDAVKNKIINEVFGVFNKDSELIDWILACTPAEEILFQVMKEFNKLFDILKRLLLDVASMVNFSADTFELWAFDTPVQRTLLFISELLESIAIEIENGGGVLCPIRRDQFGSSDKKDRINPIIDKDAATEFVTNFKAKTVPTINFSKEFLEKYNLGKEMIVKGNAVKIEDSSEISDEAINTIINHCTEELDPEKQIAIRDRIKSVLSSK